MKSPPCTAGKKIVYYLHTDAAKYIMITITVYNSPFFNNNNNNDNKIKEVSLAIALAHYVAYTCLLFSAVYASSFYTANLFI